MLPDWMVPDSISSEEASQATAERENVVTSQALAQLKAIFGAAPTEGERKILMEIQGSIGQPDSERQAIYDRGIAMAQRRLEFTRVADWAATCMTQALPDPQQRAAVLATSRADT